MNSQLEERRELIRKIELLSASDIEKLKVFLSDLEDGKAVKKKEHSRASWRILSLRNKKAEIM